MNPLNIEQTGCQSYGIFWDIENCPIPAMERATNVIKNIREFIAANYVSRVGHHSEPCAFYCSCDTQRLDRTHVEALNRSGVDILHVNPIRALNGTSTAMAYKVDADSKLKECIQKFVDHHFNTQKCLLFVITGDIDFAPAFRTAKRKGFQVILIYGSNTSQDIKNAATESHSYNDIVDPIKCMFTESSTAAINTAPNLLSGTPSVKCSVVKNPINIGASNRPSLSAQSARPRDESTVPPFIQEVQNTVRAIENQNKTRTKSGEHSNEKEFDPQLVKTIQEVTLVERHVALRVLQSTNGNVELAINLLVND